MPDRKLMVWKKVCEAVLKAVIGGLVQRVGKADALEGVTPQRIADREVQPGGGLVVVLRQRLLRRGQIGRRAHVGAW